MRKWFCNIVESMDERLPLGNNLIYDKPSPNCQLNAVLPFETMNIETGKVTQLGVTKGMGYADFKNEEDYKTRLKEVTSAKMKRAGVLED